MAQSHETGKKGEQLAAEFLKKEGYRILATNWRSGQLEIDIIALKDDVLHIIEVKARSSGTHGNPELFVDRKKQKLLARAAAHFLSLQGLDVEIRFDVMAILIHESGHQIRHIQDAFYVF